MDTSGDAALRGTLAGLYRVHAAQATRFAYLLTGDQETAADLVQEAFFRITRRFGDLRNPDAFWLYLRRTIVNLWNSELRREYRHRALVASLHEGPAVAESDLPGSGRLDVWAAIESLPFPQRAVLVLRYYEDLSDSQIADTLGCPVGTVKSRLSRALEAIHARIGGENDDEG